MPEILEYLNTTDVIYVDISKAGFAGSSSNIRVSVDDGLNITGSSVPGSATSTVDPSGKAQFTLEWTTINPRPRFDPTLPR